MASLSEKVGCRYTLVVETSKRARQLLAGALSLIDTINMKLLKVAIEEINRGLIGYEQPAGSEKEYIQFFQEFKKKTVVFEVAENIVAYKTMDSASKLKKLGASVFIVMTKNACAFVSPLTFETMSVTSVVVDRNVSPQITKDKVMSLPMRNKDKMVGTIVSFNMKFYR